MKYLQIETWRATSLAIAFIIYNLSFTIYNSQAQSADVYELFGQKTPVVAKSKGEKSFATTKNKNDNSIVYGYRPDGGGTYIASTVKFSMDATDTLDLLEDQSGTNFICGATWADRKWYGIVFTDNHLVTIDTVTGVRTILHTLVPKSGHVFTGLTYNPTNKKMYALSSDGIDSRIYTLDRSTGDLDPLIDVTGSADACLAVSKTGIFYTINLMSAMILSVDVSNWILDTVLTAPFGFGGTQEMEFDHKTGICYLSAYNASVGAGQLYTVDFSAKSLNLIGNFEGNAHITGFAIPQYLDPIDGINETTLNNNINIYPNPSNGEFTITMSNVKCQMSDVICQITDITGRVIKSEVANNHSPQQFTINMKDQPKGIYFIKIETENSVFTREIIIN